LALHGNAILSKCPLRDAFILRSSFNEKYFSDTPSFVNANGYEKRIGGRMGLFAHIHVGDLEGVEMWGTAQHVQSDKYSTLRQVAPQLFLGSIHKIQSENYDEMVKKIKAPGVVGSIIGGDQIYETCDSVGLLNLDNRSDVTFPTSCNDGALASTHHRGHHGDILCSDIGAKNILEMNSSPFAATLVNPCLSMQNSTYSLSDHAIYMAMVTVGDKLFLDKRTGDV
jgi:hypothetical protein